MKRIIFIASIFVYPLFFISDLILGEFLTLDKYFELGDLPKIYGFLLVILAIFEAAEILVGYLLFVSLCV